LRNMTIKNINYKVKKVHESFGGASDGDHVREIRRAVVILN